MAVNYRRKGRKRQASRTKNSGNSLFEGRWSWILSGLFIGLIIAYLGYQQAIQKQEVQIQKKTENSMAPQYQPDVINKPQIIQKEPVKPAEPPPVIDESTLKFNFYNMLKEQKVIIPSDLVQEEKTEGPLLQSEKPGTTELFKQNTQHKFMLQTGAFRNQADAESRKAELALLGLISKIETVSGHDSVWYRVRLGPYQHMEQVNLARTQLQSQSIKSMLITLH